ncbi:MAG TPA: non-homologous end-joining DNA ligase [Opitutaceae bacterium]|nr:non-homologous end-joining DNA ligase [Opitutaceae bacterium]
MAAAAKVKREVKFTNLDKVFFPTGKFTKGDLIGYYVDVAPFILPHLKNRPVTLIRFPDGFSGERFYEKNAPKFAPPWIKTFAVARRREQGETNYILINDAPTLAWCANIAAIELHTFLHCAPKLEQPTCVAFDLDPGEGADILTCARVAFLVKELLDTLGLESFPKVSGSKGIQLYVPLNLKVTYDATGAFANAVAQLLEKQHPELVVSQMAKVRRKGRVFIDWSQNSRSKTTVSVYSVRGKRDTPFVSMPVTWEELRRALKGKKTASFSFTPAEALRRLKKVGDLFAPVLTLKQSLPKAFASQQAPTEPSLKRYAEKRDFSKTREPSAALVRRTKSKAVGRFVIQKHAASHLHYDFRLEMEGTLKSWAVPKGVPTDLGVKRSAFAVEDHPVGYLKFEGTIPKGEYGGGTVMVWDIGTYHLLSGSVAEGSLKLELHGKKLKGEWHMFKIRSDDGKDVWLIAKSGRPAKTVTARQDDSSVLTRRSMARIAKDNDRQWKNSRRAA